MNNNVLHGRQFCCAPLPLMSLIVSHKGQKAYVYLIPFVESDEEVFLKTVIPGGKATKSYLGEGK